jgi:hypothetical protein
MPTYDTIKAQEVNFPLPQPTGTILVGTLDGATGNFTYAVPTTKETITIPPDPSGHGSTKPTKEIVTAGHVSAVNMFSLRLQFNVVHANGALSVTIPGKPKVQGGAGQTSVSIDPGNATSLTFTVQCGAQAFSPDVPLTIDRYLVGAGAIKIPVLPISILYAPPVDQQKKNVALWTTTDTAGNTTTMAFSAQNSTTVPTLSPFKPWQDLTGEMKIASQVLSKVPNAVIQGFGTALGVISGLLGSTSTTGTNGTTVQSQQTLTVSVSAGATISTNPTGGGQGKADVLYFLKNAQVCWYVNQGSLQLGLVGWDAVDAISASLLQNPNGPTGLDQAARDSLLHLDPFVAGGPTVTLPSPRYVKVETYDVNANQTYNASYTLTNTDMQQNVLTQTDVEDDSASFLAFANIGIPQTVKLQSTLTETSSAQVTTTKTITRQVQFYANPTEYYTVEVYCDVVFGTFAFRSVGSTTVPQFHGIATDANGAPLVSKVIVLSSNGQTYRTMTNAKGEFFFRAETIKAGPVQITGLKSVVKLQFTGAPVKSIALKG